MRRTSLVCSGTGHGHVAQVELLKLQRSGQFPDEDQFLILSEAVSLCDLSISLGLCKCPLILGSDLLPKLSWVMRRSSTKGTGVHEVTSQLDVPTSLTPAPNHLLWCYFVGCVKEVSKLINHPVVSLFGTRVSGTGANMITEIVNDKLFATRWGSSPSAGTGRATVRFHIFIVYYEFMFMSIMNR